MYDSNGSSSDSVVAVPKSSSYTISSDSPFAFSMLFQNNAYVSAVAEQSGEVQFMPNGAINLHLENDGQACLSIASDDIEVEWNELTIKADQVKNLQIEPEKDGSFEISGNNLGEVTIRTENENGIVTENSFTTAAKKILVSPGTNSDEKSIIVKADINNKGEYEELVTHIHTYRTEFEWKNVSWNTAVECDLEIICSECSYKQILSCEVSRKIKNNLTCTENGLAFYTASAEFKGKTYTDQVQVEEKAFDHDWILKSEIDSTCTSNGCKVYECRNCSSVNELFVQANGHQWTAWTNTAATVWNPETHKRTCTVCKKTAVRTIGNKLTPLLKTNAEKIVLKTKQSTAKFKVTKIAAGDYIVSWTSNNSKIVTVTASGVIKAGNKAGKAEITIKLASGKKKIIPVTVQKKAVATTKISGLSPKITLQRGASVTLNPVIEPITSLQKVSFRASNKKVVAVTSKGKLTAKDIGTASITVKSGSKKIVVKVTVPKIKTTKINGIPSKKILKKGKTYTLRPKLIPANSSDKITYKSSNKKIVSVTSKGKIQAKKNGTAVITVTSGKVKMRCTIIIR